MMLSNDIVALIVSASLFAAYHLYLYWRVRRDPLYSIQSVNRRARAAWVEHVMREESKDLLAVQTLRNSTMAATFFASTAVLLMVATLTLTGQADQAATSWDALNVGGVLHPSLWMAKVLLLVADFFVAFFSFAMAVRLYNHVGYQINLPVDQQSGVVTVAAVITYMNRAGAYYTVGMRAYYAAVPLVFWLFGPIFMLGGAVVLVAFLFYIDRAPHPTE